MEELAKHVVHLERLVYTVLAVQCATVLLMVIIALGGLAAGAVALTLMLVAIISAVTFYLRGYRLKANITIEAPTQVHIYQGQPEVENL